jgi:hypothetical protein
MKNGLYHLQHIEVSPIALMCKLSKYFDTYHLPFACVANTNHVSNLRHYLLGHISNSRLQLIKDPIVIKKKNLCSTINETPCSVCPMAR